MYFSEQWQEPAWSFQTGGMPGILKPLSPIVATRKAALNIG
jgi:hypothetical protein